MIVYPKKSEPFGVTLDQEACALFISLLKRDVPFQEATERAARFQQERNAEVVSPRTQKKGGTAHAM